jgi:hypothetical protein
LNKFHTAESFELLRQCGYSEADDTDIFTKVENLLQKKTLKGGNDKSSDEEMQIFEGEPPFVRRNTKARLIVLLQTQSV